MSKSQSRQKVSKKISSDSSSHNKIKSELKNKTKSYKSKKVNNDIEYEKIFNKQNKAVYRLSKELLTLEKTLFELFRIFDIYDRFFNTDDNYVDELIDSIRDINEKYSLMLEKRWNGLKKIEYELKGKVSKIERKKSKSIDKKLS